ncbi:MAG TPA: hypothetical protein VF688_14160 [Allosphingosinicella sp.]|jgi:hypothetical protein
MEAIGGTPLCSSTEVGRTASIFSLPDSLAMCLGRSLERAGLPEARMP